MKILAIGAHPDDIEIFMFGILALYKKQKHELYLGVATDGSLGGKGPKKQLIAKRKKETKNGLIELGIPHCFNFPDGHLGDDFSHKKIIQKYIFKINPDLIITHHINDYHSDHCNLSEIISKVSGHYFPIIYCETMMGLNFSPTYYVDISKVFEMKKKAILCHESQEPKRFINLVQMMNGYRAAQCNSPIGTFAECYYFKKSFPFTDISNLLPEPPKIKPFNIQNQVGFL